MSRSPSEAPVVENAPIDWQRVDAAMAYLENLDIVEMATHIVSQARAKGAKEAYNEAGGARYQLAKARQHAAVSQATICREPSEVQQQQIRSLEKINEKKRYLSGDDDMKD